jgi:predicted transcriptional regulator
MHAQPAKSDETIVKSADPKAEKQLQTFKVLVDLEKPELQLIFENNSGIAEKLIQFANKGGGGVEISESNRKLAELQVVNIQQGKKKGEDFDSESFENVRELISQIESLDTIHLMMIKRIASKKIKGEGMEPDKNFYFKNGVLYATWNDPGQNGRKIYQNIESEVTPEERDFIIQLLEKKT